MLGRDGHALIHHHRSDGTEAPHDDCPIRAVALHRQVYRSENEVFFHQDGHAIPVGVSAAPLLRGDTLEGTVLVFSDLSRVKAYQAEIQQLAFHDALTGLPNRRLLKERLTQTLGQAQRHQRQVALMYLDLDHFKEVNDTLGHDGGDELLQAVATRLTRSVRASDTVARMGGDEFVVLLPEVANRAAAEQVAQHILNALRAPISLKGQDWQVGVSIGWRCSRKVASTPTPCNRGPTRPCTPPNRAAVTVIMFSHRSPSRQTLTASPTDVSRCPIN